MREIDELSLDVVDLITVGEVVLWICRRSGGGGQDLREVA